MASTVEELRGRTSGQVITEDDPGYDEARAVYNAMIDKRPSVVVRATEAADVVAAVNHARENGLDLAVRGGGHSVPGFGTVDDGVVIDLSGMRAVTVDPGSMTARAEGGATWGDFNDATNAHGLATTGGIISTTGVAGLSLGGGIGYLARGAGLSCDNLISADVVTADGRTVTANANETRGSVLGAARRRWELRCRDVTRVPPSSRRRDLRRSDVLRGRRRRRCPPLVPRVHHRRARGVRWLPGVADRPAAAVRPRRRDTGTHSWRSSRVGRDRSIRVSRC